MTAVVASPETWLVIGAGGGIGQALVRAALAQPERVRLHAISRQCAPAALAAGAHWYDCDYRETAIAELGQRLRAERVTPVRVFICNGLLHDEDLLPEKWLEAVQRDALLRLYEANAVVPLLWLQALLPLLAEAGPAVVAVFSARVGSIADNRLGGWYGYRAAKAALNMLLKTAAIEYARRAPATKLLAFHPGTTDTALSRPFQARVAEGRLFTAEFVVERLLALMDRQRADGTLSYLDWDGKPIPW